MTVSDEAFEAYKKWQTAEQSYEDLLDDERRAKEAYKEKQEELSGLEWQLRARLEGESEHLSSFMENLGRPFEDHQQFHQEVLNLVEASHQRFNKEISLLDEADEKRRETFQKKRYEMEDRIEKLRKDYVNKL